MNEYERGKDVHEREHADLRQLIDDALGTEPDMRLRPEVMLQRARRREQMLRLASIGGVAATVAAVTVGIAVLAGASDGVPAPGPAGPLVPGGGIEAPSSSSPTSVLPPPIEPAPAPRPTSEAGAEPHITQTPDEVPPRPQATESTDDPPVTTAAG